MPTRPFDVVLALGGGNALGAFQAGVYQALHEHDLLPNWIVGASIGAINGALIAGAVPEDRLSALRAVWRADGHEHPYFAAFDSTRRSMAAAWTMIAGRPGMFGPVLSAAGPWGSERPSLFETEQLAATLDRAVDFDRLNDGPCRFTATAVDLETGEDVVFDSRRERIDARHIRASAALPVTFPPVDIDGRWLVDGGLSANLPLDPILQEPGPRPRLVLAVDLLPLAQGLPTTFGEAAGRMQDLIFAAQSRRTIDRWRAQHRDSRNASTTLVRIAYTDQANEVAGKAMDFSGPSIEHRWASGYAAMIRVIGRLKDGRVDLSSPGFNVVDADDSSQAGPSA